MQFPETQASVHTLNNGLTVILDADSSAPVISTQIWVETGSIHEGNYLGSGISHMLEHMVFKGTKSYTGTELADTVQAAGGEWNAYTTFGRTVYYIDGPSVSAKTFLSVLTEMVFAPSFPIEDFEKEKDVIRREIDMGLDDPDDQNSQLLHSTTYSTDPRRQPIIGHLDLFNQLTHDDMLAYHKQRYTTENAFISISGDFDKAQLLEELEELTAEMPRSFTHPVTVHPEPSQLGKRLKRKQFKIPTTKLNLAWQTPSLENADSAILDLLSTIIGNGRSCRLYQNIRENTDLCHHIGAWSSMPPLLPGMFCISAIVDHDKRDELEKRILQEIDSLHHSDFFDELEKVKRMTLVSQFRTLTTASGRASDLASNWHEARNLNFTKDYIDSISEITSEDIQRVAKKYLTQDKLTVTSLDPEDRVESGIDKKEASQRKEIQSHTLPNGLTILTREDTRLPTVSITIATLTGLLSETPETSGINSLLSKILPKGTTTKSGEEIATTMDTMGASFGVSCGNNTTLTSASCLKTDLPTTLGILADIYQNPSLPEDSIDKERVAMLAGLQEQATDPLSVAFKKMRSSLFGETGYGLPLGGSETSLPKLTSVELRAHHKKYFTAKNTVISIFGDINTAAAIKAVSDAFDKLTEGQRIQHQEIAAPSPSSHELKLDKQQAVLTIGFTGPSVSAEDSNALELINDYCTDMAGPLFTKIREELGLAYYVSTTQFHGINTGMVAFYLGTSPDQLELAKKTLLTEIKTIAENGIPEETLESVKITWLASNALANQKLGSLARLSAIDNLLGFAPDNHQQTPEKIKALTAEQVQAAAKKYFGSHDPVIVSVTP